MKVRNLSTEQIIELIQDEKSQLSKDYTRYSQEAELERVSHSYNL